MTLTPITPLEISVTAIYAELGIPQDAVKPLCESYAEKWRTYHNGDHILGMWNAAHGLGLSSTHLLWLGYLIVNHDRWYKVGRAKGENEHQSARLAVADLNRSSKRHTALKKLAWQGIEATISHTLDGVYDQFERIVSLLLDLDLWGLGQSPAYFAANTEAIWHEFEPRYTRREYDTGRRDWAKSFLTRPRLYHSPEFAHLEEQARENLAALAET